MTNQTSPTPAQLPFPTIRTIGPERPLLWLKLGWADFMACPGASLFYGLCFVAGGLLMVLTLGGAPEYIAAVTTGFLICGPFLAIGLYEISRRRAQQLPCNLLASMVAWRVNISNMAIFAAVLMVLFLVWARASLLVFALFYTGEIPTMATFMRFVISTDHLDFLIAYFVVGGIFAVIAFAISLVSIPLMLDRGHDAITAAIVSVRALLANVPAMFVWAGIIALLGGIGLVTFFVGILIVGPLLGHATWHAYRDLVE
jgi:uncharacterized membrane protein